MSTKRLCDLCAKEGSTQRPKDELTRAKEIVLEWEVSDECGFSRGHTFLSKLHAMRCVADNCIYWRDAYSREFMTQTNWEHRAFKRYRRFVRFKFKKESKNE